MKITLLIYEAQNEGNNKKKQISSSGVMLSFVF